MTPAPNHAYIEHRACRAKHRYKVQPPSKIDPKGYKLRSYLCPFCAGYHLTKRPFFQTNDFYDNGGQ